MIMVNQARYGGGGIYNLYCTFTSDNQWQQYLCLHEFGHSFSGLADEYYTSAVAYNEFYPAGVEPLEANITALLDPKNIKWKELVTRKTAIPTPWEKAAYEEMEKVYQKKRQETNEKIAALKRGNAPQAGDRRPAGAERGDVAPERPGGGRLFQERAASRARSAPSRGPATRPRDCSGPCSTA